MTCGNNWRGYTRGKKGLMLLLVWSDAWDGQQKKLIVERVDHEDSQYVGFDIMAAVVVVVVTVVVAGPAEQYIHHPIYALHHCQTRGEGEIVKKVSENRRQLYREGVEEMGWFSSFLHSNGLSWKSNPFPVFFYWREREREPVAIQFTNTVHSVQWCVMYFYVCVYIHIYMCAPSQVNEWRALK